MPQFDARSEKNINTLVPRAQEKARAFLQGVRSARKAARSGVIGIRVFSGRLTVGLLP
jgi:hypothetical protein